MTAPRPRTGDDDPPAGFGCRNFHCSNCGDERGGPVGHQTHQCRYRHSMSVWEAADLQPEYRRADFWEAAARRWFKDVT